MKKITAIICVSLLILAICPAFASYATPLPSELQTETTINLTPVFQAIIALLAALVTHRLIPWIVSKTDEKQQANLAAAARVAVFAAEQIYGAAKGSEKLDYAIGKLREQGFDLDGELLREAIESAVYGMNNDPFAPVEVQFGTDEISAPESKSPF